MKKNEKVLVLLGVINFIIFVLGVLMRIPEHIPQLLKIVGVTPQPLAHIVIQMIVTGGLLFIPGYLFARLFFEEYGGVERIFLSVSIWAVLFGIYDFLGAGKNAVVWYSAVGAHTVVFVLIFSGLAVVLEGMRRVKSR